MNELLAPPSRWERIVEALAYVDGSFPMEAVIEAREHWPELREKFLDELVYAVANPDDTIDEGYDLAIYAIFLAAEKRDTAFAPAILDLLKLPIRQIDGLIGESLTDGMGRCLGSVYRGDDAPMRTFAMDESRNIYVRLAIVDALIVRALEGDATPNDVAEFVFSLAQQAAVALNFASGTRRRNDPRSKYPEYFNMLVSLLAELGATHYWPAIEQWEIDGLIAPMNGDMASLRETIFASEDDRRARMHKPYYVRDTVEEMSWWACFNEPETYVREQPKVGRNDPCPCGSGKKFKKCCGANL